ncbi:MAG: bifunctional glutamate N-acetyltransferase/amino-acid acetyltransferase ArgJ [Planctomycetota bacterium]|nr:MAG: bifunctional glutamate N-acetyltransferase/amino-acid acetyltransferase ArgJ [Planctomycetota bacterium]
MKNSSITSPQGFRAGATACGIKDSGNLDLGVLVAEASCSASAVFTRNRFCGAPVIVGREHIRNGRLRAMVVNSGCSNVATGKRGIADARKMCRLVAKTIGAAETDILPSSTGVIGEFMPMASIQQGIYQALASLSSSATAGRRFARAIMTTDTKPKEACEQIRIGRSQVTIAGCCKGSGMIAPNMATMLGFITTDAIISARELKRLLTAAVEPTFNRVTIDECESTSDTVAIMASGLGGTVENRRAKASFASSLLSVCESLAYQIVADGEGATKVLEVTVTGAKNTKDAHAAARAVAVSPLVKTAVNGGDPNWGRIIQALGAISVAYRTERVTVRLDNTTIFTKGAPARRLEHRQLAKIMKQKHVPITIDLGAGRSRDRVLTCDLSREYVTINADYHT